MALPVRHRDILMDFYNDSSHAIWARDLVGKIVINNGELNQSEIDDILNEILTPPSVLNVNLTSYSDNPYPKIEINKLTHINGVKALANNQSIDFCNEGHTYLFGHNGSGKSSYFDILNQLACGKCVYPIEGNVYFPTPIPIRVSIDYSVDNVSNSFLWNGIDTTPSELKHIRLFDSQYAEQYLSNRDNNEYIFRSYNLQRFAGLANALSLLKELGAPMGADEIFLDVLCNNIYRNTFIRALQDRFKQELVLLGMDYLQVQLFVNDLLKPTADIKVCITNAHDIHNVLSEAEKKCAALALFFAEYELLEVKQPLVFDDPVNSLDTKIIQYFADRLATINSQVILFTHNAQLLTLLQEKDGHEFRIYNNISTIRSSSKIHVLMYDIIANAPHEPGFIINHKECKSKHYLDEANTFINSNPIMNDTQPLVNLLRIALEWMVDEVIFFNQHPLIYRGKDNIPWTNLMKMVQFDPNKVLEMNTIYSILSNSGTHVGLGSTSNPLTRAQLITIKNQIESIRQIVYP